MLSHKGKPNTPPSSSIHIYICIGCWVTSNLRLSMGRLPHINTPYYSSQSICDEINVWMWSQVVRESKAFRVQLVVLSHMYTNSGVPTWKSHSQQSAVFLHNFMYFASTHHDHTMCCEVWGEHCLNCRCPNTHFLKMHYHFCSLQKLQSIMEHGTCWCKPALFLIRIELE